MSTTKARRNGFTLIELLIVVAIIAILAAIAVPNFLEAQTRAKVSRAKNDLRTLATAEEAYFVDWNSYTKYDRGDSWGPGGTIIWEGWKQLTTPVAYTTSIPLEPFGITRTNATTANASPPVYELGTGAAGIGPSAPQASGTPDRPMQRSADTWMMNSNGPDKMDDTRGGAGPPPHTYSWTEWNYPWEDLNANDPAKVAEALGMVYDPTNGTVSYGDIFRFGGMKPAGQAFDVLYAAAGK
jgi:prepilin-type N-terminal cleavage/methylation domain-containing protein